MLPGLLQSSWQNHVCFHFSSQPRLAKEVWPIGSCRPTDRPTQKRPLNPAAPSFQKQAAYTPQQCAANEQSSGLAQRPAAAQVLRHRPKFTTQAPSAVFKKSTVPDRSALALLNHTCNQAAHGPQTRLDMCMAYTRRSTQALPKTHSTLQVLDRRRARHPRAWIRSSKPPGCSGDCKRNKYCLGVRLGSCHSRH